MCGLFSVCSVFEDGPVFSVFFTIDSESGKKEKIIAIFPLYKIIAAQPINVISLRWVHWFSYRVFPSVSQTSVLKLLVRNVI